MTNKKKSVKIKLLLNNKKNMNSDFINFIVIVIGIVTIFLTIKWLTEDTYNYIKNKNKKLDKIDKVLETNKSINIERKKIIYTWNLIGWMLEPIGYTIIIIAIWFIIYQGDKVFFIIYGIIIWLIYVPSIIYYQIKYFFDNLEIE